MTTIARVLQWPRVMPLYFIVFHFRKWKARVMPLISRVAAERKAIRTAFEIAEVGTLVVEYGEQHVGYYRLWVSQNGFTRKTVWTLDIWHNVHFTGRWSSVPNLKQAKRIKFKALREPLHGSRRTHIASYLKIEHVS